jgi:hypothetical protein
MSAVAEDSQQAALERLQTISTALADRPHSETTAAARELLQVVFNLHARGLARMLELIGESAGGSGVLERLAHDEQTRGLLLLHDLHPQDRAARTAAALAGLHPHLAVYGVRTESFTVDGGVLRLTLHSAAAASDVRPPPPEALRGEIEAAVYALAPDLESIEIDGLPVPAVYVPLTQLRRSAQPAAGPE